MSSNDLTEASSHQANFHPTNLYQTSNSAFAVHGFAALSGAGSPPASTGPPASFGLGTDQNERVATPRTQARQDEQARLYQDEQDRFIDNGNASQTGSALERHMTNFVGRLEDGSTRRGQIRSVNFAGTYGPIREVASLTNGVPPVQISAAPSACNPHTYASAKNNHAQALTSPRTSVFSHSSARSQLQRRRGYRNLAHQANSTRTPFLYSSDYENEEEDDYLQQNINIPALGARPANLTPQHATAQSVPESPPTPAQRIPHAANIARPQQARAPRQQVPVAAQRPPHVAAGDIGDNADENPPDYVNRNQDHLLPPHIDPNDPVGRDFLAGMQEVRRAQDGVQTLAAGLGLHQDNVDVQAILQGLQNSVQQFTTGFRRAAAAAEQHRIASDRQQNVSNQIRGNMMRMQRHLRANVAEIEDLGAQLHGVRFINLNQGMQIALQNAENARLHGHLNGRRAESERLVREVEELTAQLWGL